MGTFFINKENNRPIDWYNVFNKFGDVIVVLCNDEKGIEGTKRSARRFGKKMGFELKKMFQTENIIAYKLVGEKREADNKA